MTLDNSINKITPSLSIIRSSAWQQKSDFHIRKYLNHKSKEEFCSKHSLLYATENEKLIFFNGKKIREEILGNYQQLLDFKKPLVNWNFLCIMKHLLNVSLASQRMGQCNCKPSSWSTKVQVQQLPHLSRMQRIPENNNLKFYCHSSVQRHSLHPAGITTNDIVLHLVLPALLHLLPYKSLISFRTYLSFG